jgi:hypothetical protein
MHRLPPSGADSSRDDAYVSGSVSGRSDTPALQGSARFPEEFLPGLRPRPNADGRFSKNPTADVRTHQRSKDPPVSPKIFFWGCAPGPTLTDVFLKIRQRTFGHASAPRIRPFPEEFFLGLRPRPNAAERFSKDPPADLRTRQRSEDPPVSPKSFFWSCAQTQR